MSYDLVEGAPKCVKEGKVAASRVCHKWHIDTDKNGYKCTETMTNYPQSRCLESFKHNSSDYCKKMELLEPQYYCSEYGVLKSHRVCKQRKVYYGKDHYFFRCTKIAILITKIYDDGHEEEVSGCIKYEKVLKRKYEDKKNEDSNKHSNLI